MQPKGQEKPVQITFDDIKPNAFNHAILWFYRNTLSEIDVNNEEDAKRPGVSYAHLYRWAGKWDVHELQNRIMDRIRERPTRRLGWFPPKLVELVYDANCNNNFTGYLIDNWLYKSTKRDYAEHAEHTQDQMADNPNFFGEIF